MKKNSGRYPKDLNEHDILPTYECDPNKNKTCTKEGCIFNPYSAYPCCHRTTNEKYKWDGKTDRKIKGCSDHPIDIKEEN